MKVSLLPACLQLDPHVCEEVSSRRIQDKVPESASEASSEDHNLVGAAWLVVKLDIVDGTVNVTKCIGALLKCMELSGMLILVLVLKDSLRTFFKSLSWSLGVRSLHLPWSLGVRSLSLSWSLRVRSLSLSWSLWSCPCF